MLPTRASRSSNSWRSTLPGERRVVRRAGAAHVEGDLRSCVACGILCFGFRRIRAIHPRLPHDPPHSAAIATFRPRIHTRPV